MTRAPLPARHVASEPLSVSFSPGEWTRLGEPFVWLDSAIGTPDRGRRSLAVLSTETVLTVDHPDRSCVARLHVSAEQDVPAPGVWTAADELLRADAAAHGGTPELGWIGYVTYEARVLADEAHGARAESSPYPAIRFDRVTAAVLCVDGVCRLVASGGSRTLAEQHLSHWRGVLATATDTAAIRDPVAAFDQSRQSLPPGDYSEGANYRHGVSAIRAAIGRGDIYQACLTFPITFGEVDGPLDRHYEAIRAHSPADYSAYVRLGALECASASPERFFKISGRVVEARPMKGTAGVGGTPAENDRIASNLRASAKDRAENVMIVDLLRNDLGRVCEAGSVTVPALFEVERYATAHQLTSTVRGTLRDGVGPFAVLAAAFPPGSMTGTPKVAACRLLAQLERGPRGIYSGTIGWLGFDGECELSVVIRTLHRRGGQLLWNVGGGVVWDSTPDGEWDEALQKARPLGGLLRSS